MKSKEIKKLVILLMLILQSTVYYTQTVIDKNSNSGVTLTLNEAEYFINQNTKAEYFENDNKNLIKKDSLNIQQIGYLRNIISNGDSIINIQRSIINNKDTLVKLENIEIQKTNNLNNKLSKKVKVRNTLLVYSTIAIILEGLVLFFTL